MAADFGFGATNVMSQYIHGQRKLTKKSASNIITKLGLVKLDRRYFDALLEYCNANDLATAEKYFELLYAIRESEFENTHISDQMKYFSRWIYPVIGELANLDDFEDDVDWIMTKLNHDLSRSDVAQAIALLKALRIWVKNPTTEKFVRSKIDFSTEKEVTGIAIKSYHKEMMDQGSRSLYKLNASERSINALTLACDKKEFEALKEKISALIQDALKIESQSERKSDIIQLNIQLFPFTKKS